MVSNAASWCFVLQTLLITVIGRFRIDLILIEFMLYVFGEGCGTFSAVLFREDYKAGNGVWH